jgi:hypothetical protein
VQHALGDASKGQVPAPGRPLHNGRPAFAPSIFLEMPVVVLMLVINAICKCCVTLLLVMVDVADQPRHGMNVSDMTLERRDELS